MAVRDDDSSSASSTENSDDATGQPSAALRSVETLASQPILSKEATKTICLCHQGAAVGGDALVPLFADEGPGSRGRDLGEYAAAN